MQDIKCVLTKRREHSFVHIYKYSIFILLQCQGDQHHLFMGVLSLLLKDPQINKVCTNTLLMLATLPNNAANNKRHNKPTPPLAPESGRRCGGGSGAAFIYCQSGGKERWPSHPPNCHGVAPLRGAEKTQQHPKKTEEKEEHDRHHQSLAQ